jgi:hypothetical protein
MVAVDELAEHLPEQNSLPSPTGSCRTATIRCASILATSTGMAARIS